MIYFAIITDLSIFVCMNNEDIYGKSNPELIRELGLRFKEYRLACRLTQQEVADRAGVSLFTVRAFEGGKAVNITMNSFVGLLRSIGYLEEMNKLLPELPVSVEILHKLQSLKPKRIRHGK